MTSLICGELEDAGHTVTTTTRPAEALFLLDKHSFDIVITDLSMPDIDGMKILEKGLEKDGTEVILMTAFGSIESAVKAMKLGAADYLIKPFSLEELALQVKKLADKQKLSSLKEHFEQAAMEKIGVEFIGTSSSATRIKTMIAKVAPASATVLLTGRSGTGKELAARMIHDISPRKAQPFIAVNCAALTETLLESELFGHEKGAFTGAVARKRGRFELAERGTIFLDEIGEMPLSMQTKLLRVLEERNLVRVGGVDTIPIDVRVIAATNRNLKTEIQTGKFREDLYFRLNVFPIEMPALSERGNDVIEIAISILRKLRYAFSTLDKPVADLLISYDWPGNIRELRNALERAVILADGERLTVDHFSLDIESDSDSRPLVTNSRTESEGLEQAEREMILKALEKSEGNKTEAAKLLKITRRRLYSRMKAHEIKG